VTTPALPASGPVLWSFTYGESTATHRCQTWYEARRTIAAKLGCAVEDCDPRRVREDET